MSTLLTSGYRYYHNDVPTATLYYNTLTLLVTDAIGFEPLTEALTSPTSVTMFNGATAVGGSKLYRRFNCTYSQFAGPIVCDSIGRWYAKLHGRDFNGYEYVRTVPFDCVGQLASSTSTATTGISTPTTGPLPQQCYCDIVFVVCVSERVFPLIDEVGDNLVWHQLQIVSSVLNVSRALNVTPTASHIGVVAYSSPTRTAVLIQLDDDNEVNEYTDRLLTTDWPQLVGVSDIDSGLRTAASMFTAANGDRPDAPNMVVLLSDGL